jgi:hypothetical protein
VAGLRDRKPGSSVTVTRARTAGCLAAAILVPMLAACGAAAQPTSSSSAATTAAAAVARASTATSAAATPPAASTAPCGSSAPQARAQAAGFVARRIYGREVSSPEVSRDQRQVEGYTPLLRALAGGSRGAIAAAVTSLVFSHTHVVRLRISSSAGSLLADVGGPYILAPVGGTLRLAGRTVGRYLLSVQDDSGYAKLESRYIGYPLLMRQGARRLPVEGTISPGSTFIPDRGPASWHGARYEVFSFGAQAYPSGPLKISMLVPPASAAVSCTAIRIAELNRIAQRVWRRFQLVGAPVSGFVSTMGSLLGALSYVRAGSHQLSGSTVPGPARLPAQGTVSYHGVSYHVFSFPADGPSGPVRAYQLVRAP